MSQGSPLRRTALLVVAFCVVCACDDAVDEPVVELRTEARCDGGAPAYDVVVEPRIAEVGPSSNDIIDGVDAIWIVESASNTVSRFDRGEERMDSGYVDIGNDRNPYAGDIDEGAGEIWIANFISDSLTIADITTGEIIAELQDPSFADPSAVALTDEYAYVANVEYLSADEGFGDGRISVVDRGTREVVASVESAFKNPQFLTVMDIDGAPTLLVSASGSLDIDDGDVSVASEGGLQWLDIEEDPVDPPSQSFSVGQQPGDTTGAIGRAQLTPDGDRLYFASGVAPVLFAFDIAERQWRHDAEDPLPLYDTDGEATHTAAMGADGLLWITAFNQDALYLFDTACDELVAPAIDLGEVADMLEGPQALHIYDNGEGAEGYYLLGIANSLGRVRLQ